LKMTKYLMQTYQSIELGAKHRALPPLENIFQVDKTIKKRYLITKQLGRGVFGLVVQAKDMVSGELNAIKIMPDKSEEGDRRMRDQAG